MKKKNMISSPWLAEMNIMLILWTHIDPTFWVLVLACPNSN